MLIKTYTTTYIVAKFHLVSILVEDSIRMEGHFCIIHQRILPCCNISVIVFVSVLEVYQNDLCQERSHSCYGSNTPLLSVMTSLTSFLPFWKLLPVQVVHTLKLYHTPGQQPPLSWDKRQQSLRQLHGHLLPVAKRKIIGVTRFHIFGWKTSQLDKHRSWN